MLFRFSLRIGRNTLCNTICPKQIGKYRVISSFQNLPLKTFWVKFKNGWCFCFVLVTDENISIPFWCQKTLKIQHYAVNVFDACTDCFSESIWRIINIYINPYLALKLCKDIVLENYLFREAHSFPSVLLSENCLLLWTVNFRGQISTFSICHVSVILL